MKLLSSLMTLFLILCALILAQGVWLNAQELLQIWHATEQLSFTDSPLLRQLVFLLLLASACVLVLKMAFTPEYERRMQKPSNASNLDEQSMPEPEEAIEILDIVVQADLRTDKLDYTPYYEPDQDEVARYTCLPESQRGGFRIQWDDKFNYGDFLERVLRADPRTLLVTREEGNWYVDNDTGPAWYQLHVGCHIEHQKALRHWFDVQVKHHLDKEQYKAINLH